MPHTEVVSLSSFVNYDFDDNVAVIGTIRAELLIHLSCDAVRISGTLIYTSHTQLSLSLDDTCTARTRKVPQRFHDHTKWHDPDPLGNQAVTQFDIVNSGRDGAGGALSCGQGSLWRVQVRM